MLFIKAPWVILRTPDPSSASGKHWVRWWQTKLRPSVFNLYWTNQSRNSNYTSLLQQILRGYVFIQSMPQMAPVHSVKLNHLFRSIILKTCETLVKLRSFLSAMGRRGWEPRKTIQSPCQLRISIYLQKSFSHVMLLLRNEETLPETKWKGTILDTAATFPQAPKDSGWHTVRNQ